MSVETMPDVEGALRTWLRGQASLTALVGQRIFFGVPRKVRDESWPMITLRRVGGGDALGEAPVDEALIQLDVWGALDGSGNGDKAGATAIVNTLRSLLRSVDHRTVLSGTDTALGIGVESVVWLPDPDNDRPRYSVTAVVTAIHT